MTFLWRLYEKRTISAPSLRMFLLLGFLLQLFSLLLYFPGEWISFSELDSDVPYRIFVCLIQILKFLFTVLLCNFLTMQWEGGTWRTRGSTLLFGFLLLFLYYGGVLALDALTEEGILLLAFGWILLFALTETVFAVSVAALALLAQSYLPVFRRLGELALPVGISLLLFVRNLIEAIAQAADILRHTYGFLAPSVTEELILSFTLVLALLFLGVGAGHATRTLCVPASTANEEN